MLFNSKDFLIFFPIVVIVYQLIPSKVKYLWLLGASYYFYMCWNAKYVVLLLTTTVITYLSSLLLEKVKKRGESGSSALKKGIVAFCILANIGILFYFKYINFFTSLLSRGFSFLHIELNIPVFDVLLPVGISFYTFQAIGYVLDVYRDEIYAEHNFFRYALFVSFFPQLVAGPIERSKNLLKQLADCKKITFENLRLGTIYMLWGYFLKIVLADRVAVFVDNVYGNYTDYPGVYLILATMLFAVQIYCDFSGYSVIAIGAAKILGIDLMKNFDAPYLATSVKDFWRRWHISLTSWFRDYLYIPLGGSRKGTFRRYLNIMIVFLTSGLWHGASLSFVAWGGLNGAYQVIGELLMPVRKKIGRLLFPHPDSFPTKLLKWIGTFLCVDFSWIFFRAPSLSVALRMIKSMAGVHNVWILFDGSLFSLGLGQNSFYLMLLSIVLLFIVDLCNRKGILISQALIRQDGWFQIAFIVISALAIVLFGVWGGSFDAKNFIYFQF